jgi:hypothetical protein
MFGGMGMKRVRSYSEDALEEIEYEKLRNARLVENRKRMEELGLKGLSQQLTESGRTSPAISGSRSSSRLRGTPSQRLPSPIVPSRRSSRLIHTELISLHLQLVFPLPTGGFFCILHICFCFL